MAAVLMDDAGGSSIETAVSLKRNITLTFKCQWNINVIDESTVG